MRIKFLVITAVLATAILCFGGVSNVKAAVNCMAYSNVNDQISCLQQVIAELVQQIAALQAQQGTTSAWCHTFNTNLGYANSGLVEVGYLHTALDREIISYSPDTANQYSEGTMSAVVQFQAKYGIMQTGYVGPITRAKLNSLYGCTQNPPPSTVCTPNWQCGWGSCVNGSKSQVATDSNNCGLPSSSANIACPALVQVCTPTQPSTTCTDSDGGANYNVKGTTTGLNVYNETTTTTDYCVYAGQQGTYGQYLQSGQQAVMEYTCSSDGKTINDDLHVCPNGCLNGACIQSTVQPSVTVTSPNGGETFVAGQNINIVWSVLGIGQSDVSNIDLIDYTNANNPNSYILVTNLPGNTGNYNYIIPSNIATGSKFKIEVYSVKAGIAYPDYSDNYFSIVAPTTCTPGATQPCQGALVQTCTSSGQWPGCPAIPTATAVLSVALTGSHPRELSNFGTSGVWVDLGTFRFTATVGNVYIQKLKVKKLGTLPNSAIKSIWLKIVQDTSGAPQQWQTPPITSQIVDSLGYITFQPTSQPTTIGVISISNNYYTDVTIQAMVLGTIGDTIGVGIDSASAIESNADIQNTTFPLNNTLVTRTLALNDNGNKDQLASISAALSRIASEIQEMLNK